MTDTTSGKRTDVASRMIQASPAALYQAFVDADAVASWRPPAGMTCRVLAFDARVGGGYHMAFAYTDAGHSAPGKTTEHEDVFEGRFVELIPGERIVEEVVFESDAPEFAGTMRIITEFVPVSGGTEVTIRCEDVPSGIGESDHQAGLKSTLANLARFTE